MLQMLRSQERCIELAGDERNFKRGECQFFTRNGFFLKSCVIRRMANTLMIQKVLDQPHWHGKLIPRNDVTLTALIWEHVNLYGYVIVRCGNFPKAMARMPSRELA